MASTRTLTDREWQTVIHALRVAVVRFDENERTCDTAGHHELAAEFKRYADDTRKLADQLED